MAQVDFYNMLSGLGDTIAKQRTEAARKEAFANINNPDGTVDFQKAIMGLTRAGDVEGAARISQLAGAAEDRKFRQQAFSRKETPESVRVLEAAGLDPKSPEGRSRLFPKSEDKPMSPSEMKELFKNEDAIPALDATISNIKRAKELNADVYTGFGASARGALGAKATDWLVPDAIASPKSGKATAEWEQIMGGEGLKNMSETLKGASTDFEMKKFLDMAANTSLPADVRNNAMDRFLALADAEKLIREKRIVSLKDRSYAKPMAGAATSYPAAAVEALKADPNRRDQFDAKYGAGAAMRALGGQ